MALEYINSENGLDIQLLIGTVNIIDDIESLGELSHSIDFPNPQEYRVGNFDFVLIDETGKYSPEKENNFWSINGARQSGIGSTVELKAQYIGETDFERIFYGKIDNIEYNPETGEVSVQCADAMRDILTTKIVDFGTPEDLDHYTGNVNIGRKRRTFRLNEDKSSDNIRGVYPIAETMLPLSDKSIVVKSDLNTTLTQVEKLSQSGDLDWKKYIVTSTGIETELPIPETSGYPQLTCKSPYRWKTIEFLIKKLMVKIDVNNTLDINIPTITLTNNIFNRRGKDINDLMNTETLTVRNSQGTAITIPGSNIDDNIATVGGYITDMIEDNGKLYKTFTVRRGDTVNYSLIIEEDPITETSKVLYRRPKLTGYATEFWGIAKSDNIIFVLACDSQIRERVLDDLPDVEPLKDITSGIGAITPYIISYNITTNTATTLVAKGATLTPLLYRHGNYLGQTIPDYREIIPQNRNNLHKRAIYPSQSIDFNLPDAVRGFEVYNDELYYCYQTSTNRGVAKLATDGTVTSVVEINRDSLEGGYGTGISFSIVGSTLSGSYTFMKNSESSIVIFEIDL